MVDVPDTVIPEANVKEPKILFAKLKLSVLVNPVQVISAPSRGISTVYVPAAELASKITVSWQRGTETPPAPPEVADQVAVADQSPATTA